MKPIEFMGSVTDIDEKYIADAYDFAAAQNERKRTQRRTALLLAAAILLMIAVSLGVFFSLRGRGDAPFVGQTTAAEINQSTPTEESAIRVYLDADSSVMIEASEDLSVQAVREPADHPALGRDYRAAPLRKTVVEIASSMIGNGQLSSACPIVLLTVEQSDAEAAERLSLELERDIDALFKQELPEGKVETYTLDRNTASGRAAQLSKEYGISYGKAQIVARAAEMSENYKEEELCELPVSLLYAMLSEQFYAEFAEITNMPGLPPATLGTGLITFSDVNGELYCTILATPVGYDRLRAEIAIVVEKADGSRETLCRDDRAAEGHDVLRIYKHIEGADACPRFRYRITVAIRTAEDAYYGSWTFTGTVEQNGEGFSVTPDP